MIIKYNTVERLYQGSCKYLISTKDLFLVNFVGCGMWMPNEFKTDFFLRN
jgi:hypothetical protein